MGRATQGLNSGAGLATNGSLTFIISLSSCFLICEISWLD